jgi:putative PIN family toxin of toxin-antitoxin system
MPGITYNTIMKPRIVIDTNVLIAALRSRNGASYQVIKRIGQGLFDLVLSVPLVLEYEDVAKRSSRSIGLRHSDVDDILDYLCQIGEHREIFFLWRPFLKDPKDDMVLEVAVESRSDFIVTHNIKDFGGIGKFGLEAIRPGAFLRKLEN